MIKPKPFILVNWLLFLCCLCQPSYGQSTVKDTFYLLKPDRVFDGEQMHEGWQVLVHNHLIEAVGMSGAIKTPAGTIIRDLKGATLLPGLIEGHSHLFLHPYNEVSWDDQVLKETLAERIARATVHARATLLAGFTTIRDLGTEGAGYSDVGLKEAIDKGVIPGPHMLIATRAIVATGSYGPRSLSNDIEVPRGAAEADGTDALIKEVRTQIGHGADLVKVYADYHWGRDKYSSATFTIDELKRVVEVAGSCGRLVAVHAGTAEGMRRSILAGVATVEHGDEGTPELFSMMRERGIALCPTIAAGEAIAHYRGWRKGIDPEPDRIAEKRKSFRAALASGVRICMGGDVGVYAHGDNAREMEAMVEYGMPPIDVLRSATSVNADVFGISNKAGRIRSGMPADLLVVEGNPSVNISQIRKILLVMKDGVIVSATL
jgi:imidazolonepropionase-like amidohydrolase